MANPQLEDGYTQIADTIIEALARFRLSGHESQCLWFIIRKTFGFQKKTDMIALSQFSQGTNLPRPKVCNALKKLKTRGLIIAQKGNSKGNIYKFNKDFDQWKSLPKRGITQKGSPQKGNQVVPKRGHTIKTLTIENKDNMLERFEEFWKTYSKKKAKQAALKVWTRLNPSKDLSGKILKAVEDQKSWPDWKKESGKYIPYPATWLRGGCWEDEAGQELVTQQGPHLMTAEELRKQRNA